MTALVEECRAMIKILTGKSHVHFTSRCNESIKVALLLVAKLERHLVLFQEEGGWLTYEKYITQAGLEPIKMVTDDGLLYEQELKRYSYDVALILNSMPGYAAHHDMATVYDHCLRQDIFLINDVSGSIGTAHARYGDIIVGSFGKGKPVDVGRGGFIATNDEDYFKELQVLAGDEPEMDYTLLHHKLKTLDKRRSFLLSRAKQIKQDLIEYDVAHDTKEGFNVIVRFNTEDEKQNILDYCKTNNLEYTECPREIRILDTAISIEVKRLEGFGE
jgi:hypothetical protein